jgi:hypothetical protein
MPDAISVHDDARWSGVTDWFNSEDGAVAAHSQIRLPGTVGLEDMSDFNNPDPRPMLTSELVTTPADWAHAEVSGGYFAPVAYRGAFAPTIPMSEQWTAGWTNFDPQWTDYDADMTGIGDAVVEGRSMSQNYPNPFNPVTKIAYRVRQAGPVTIKIHSASGRVVRTLLDTELDAGASGVVIWDGTDDAGDKCASGVYFYSIDTLEGSENHKMVMMK